MVICAGIVSSITSLSLMVFLAEIVRCPRTALRMPPLRGLCDCSFSEQQWTYIMKVSCALPVVCISIFVIFTTEHRSPSENIIKSDDEY